MRAALRIWFRIVRSEPALAVTILVVTAVTAAVTASGIRLFDSVSSEDLRQALVTSEPEQRSIRVETNTRLGAGSGENTFNQLERRGERFFEEEMSDLTRSVIHRREWVLQSPPFRVSSFPESEDGPFVRTLRFRYQSGLDDQMTIVQGRLPETRDRMPLLFGPECPEDITAVEEFEAEQELAADQDLEGERLCSVVDVPVYEVAITAETATDLMVEFGDTIFLRPEPMHPLWASIRADRLSDRIVVDIVGITELSDVTDPYWFSDNTLHRPRISENPDVRFIFASGVMHDQVYGRLLRDVPDVHLDYAWRYMVDPDLVNADEAAQLALDVDKLATPDADVLSELPVLIGDHKRQRSVTASLLSIFLSGFVTISAAGVFVVASLAARRQIDAMSLVMNRGVGIRSVRALGLWHGTVLAVPAAIAGLTLGISAVPEAAITWEFASTVVVAVSVVLVTAWAVRSASTVASDGTIAGNEARTEAVEAWFSGRFTTSGIRRVIRDATVVVLAVAAAVLIRQRASVGLTEVGETGSLGADVDPLLAVVAPLVGLASGLVLLRLSKPLFRFLAKATGFMRGPVSLIGFRRLVDQDRSARAAMVVVGVAVAVSGLAASVERTVVHGQRDHAWQLAASDLVVRAHADGVAVPEGVAELVRSRSSAVVTAVERTGTVVVSPSGTPAVQLMAIDPGLMQDLLSESPLPAVDLSPLQPTTSADKLPAFISGQWADSARPSPGTEMVFQIGIEQVEVEILGAIAQLPSTPANRPIVIADRESLSEVLGIAMPSVTALFVSVGDSDDAGALAQAVAEFDPSARVVDRAAVLRSFESDPFVRWSVLGLRLLAALSLLIGVVAMLSSLAITAPSRRRNIGLLSVIGLRPRQAAMLSAMEQFAPFLLAVAGGIALSIELAMLLDPVLDFGPFTGDLLAVTLVPSTRWLLVVGLAVVLGLVVSVSVAAIWKRRFGGPKATPTTLNMGGHS